MASVGPVAGDTREDRVGEQHGEEERQQADQHRQQPGTVVDIADHQPLDLHRVLAGTRDALEVVEA